MSDSLNIARGKLEIDTSQPEQVPGIMRGVAQGINSAMTQVSAGSNQASVSIGQVTSALRGLAGAFGFSMGIQGVKQLADAAISATELTAAYNRQLVAARNLAGTQDALNRLLDAYQEAMGGAVDKATALSAVTNLMAQGFAGSTEQVKQFASGVRGASIAMGQSQEYIQQYVALAIANQSTKRLNEIGLGIAEVENRIRALQSASADMSREAAFQAAILQLLNEKYGALATSEEGQKTGLEKAGSAAKDFGLTIGTFIGPTVNLVGEDVNRTFHTWQSRLEVLIQLSTLLGNALHGVGQSIGLIGPDKFTGPIASRSGLGQIRKKGVDLDTPHAMEYQPSAEENVIRLDWAKGIREQTKQANDQIAQENDNFNRQRLQSDESYYKAASDAAEDFARSRVREEQELGDSIARLQRDNSEREQKQAEELGRSVADATSQSEDRIAKARKDAAKRLSELDENYEKERVKRAKDLSDQLLDAAGDLNAKEVYELQRNAARQDEEAKTAHDDQRKKLQEQLDERIGDERANLAKSIAERKDAYERQLQDARDADAQRIQDMKDDLKKRQDQEDTDYGIRMGRMRRDHDDQLAEMDRVHADRITQIGKQGDDDLTALADQHKRQIDELKGHNSQYHNELKKADDDALAEFTRLTNPVRVWLRNPTAPLVTPGMAGTSSPYITSPTGSGSSYSNSSRSVTIGNVTVSLGDVGGRSDEQIKRIVRDGIIEALEEVAQ